MMKLFAPVAIAGLVSAQAALAAEVSIPDETFDRKTIDGRSVTTLGLGAGYLPKYEGSNEHQWRAIPLIDIQRGHFFIGMNGIGYDFSSNPDLQIGPRLSYRGGRKESDSVRLRGMGDIGSGAEAGAFARMKFGAWFVRGDIRLGMGNADGTVVQFGGGHMTRIGDSDHVVLDASATWADSKYTNAYFGVTAAQAAASGFAAYTPGSGIKRYDIGANWIHSFPGKWFSSLGLRAGNLSGDAANSPLVENKQQWISSVILGYRF